jgi:O-antigen/teichoic acid export membrane protein
MSIRRSFAWAFSGQFISFAMQFVGMVVVSRLLSPREIGIYAIAMAALGIIGIFTTFGIGSFIVREADLSPGTLESAFTVNAILAVSLSTALFGLSFLAGPLLGATEAGGVLRVVALGNLLGIIGFRPSTMMQREMQFKTLSIIAVATTCTQTVATIGFALGGASYMSPAYASLISGALAVALNVYLGRGHSGFRLSLAGWRPIVTFGLQMMSVSGVAVLTGKLSDILLGRLLGIMALGLYARASQLSGNIFDNLYGTATRVMFAQLSKSYREGGDWRGSYLRSFSMITALMWPFLIGLAILSRPAVLLLYGEKWLPAALPLSALLVAQFIGVSFGMNWELFALRGETGKQARFEVARLLLGLPIFAIGCLFTIVSAASAKIVDALIGLFIYYPQVRRLADLEGHEIPRIYGQSALLTVAAVLPSAIAMIAYDGSPYIPLPIVAGAVAVGTLFWFGTIIVMKHPLLAEFRIVADRLLRSRAAT